MSYPTLDAALQYASEGFRVLPLAPQSKVPDLRHWPEEASTDPDAVRRHFAASEARARRKGKINDAAVPNVGIATGAGLVVVDVDYKHGGAVPEWMPDTLMVDTASGGHHFYLAVDRAVPCSVSRIATGVDVRGERGQVVAPPSVVELDRRVVNDTMFESWTGSYTWVDEDRAIAPIDWQLVTPADILGSFDGRHVRRAFEWRDEVPVGERNNYLTSLAGHLMATGTDAADTLAELYAEADRLGFAPTRERELEKIVGSVRRYH